MPLDSKAYPAPMRLSTPARMMHSVMCRDDARKRRSTNVGAAAIAVHFFAYRWVRGSAAPLFADELALPKLRHIDARLVGGSALFGVGWGLGGYCPGPGIVALGTGRGDALLFVAAMALGWLIVARLDAWRPAPTSTRQGAPSGASRRDDDPAVSLSDLDAADARVKG